MAVYDEDVNENSFMLNLLSEYSQLYQTAADNRWMILVPRHGSVVPSYKFTEQDFLTQILIVNENDDAQYSTLSDKQVKIEGSRISTVKGFIQNRNVSILFEETFFNDNDESFRVLCVSHLLEGGSDSEGSLLHQIQLITLEDCTDLMWGHQNKHNTKKNLDSLIELFNRTSAKMTAQTLRHYMDAVHTLFSKGMQIVLKDTYLKKTAKANPMFLDSVKVAVESYLMHHIYRRLFSNISACVSQKDAQLNKITRNLSSLQLKDLGVQAEYYQNIPRARKEICNLNRYSTPLGKLNCVKRVLKFIMQQPRRGSNSEPLSAITADDILPIFVFLIVKSPIANWWSNFTFMTQFRFSKISNDQEFGYCHTSLEAALEHVSSGSLKLSLPVSTQLSQVSNNGLWNLNHTQSEPIEQMFQFVRDNDVSSARELLNKSDSLKPSTTPNSSNSCHPLCSCPKCSTEIGQEEDVFDQLESSVCDEQSVTAYSRDDMGGTALHLAAFCGHTEMLDFLISFGASLNATDYNGSTPLHTACQKGQQASTLLLLTKDCAVNTQDNDGNTALHLAADNGHEHCVKALVFYDQGRTSLDMNIGNDFGDTALHLACKWGYVGLIETLLENGASATIRNRKRFSPLQIAHNSKIVDRLKVAIKQQVQISQTSPRRASLQPSTSTSVASSSASTLPRRASVQGIKVSNKTPRVPFPSERVAGVPNRTGRVPRLPNMTQKNPLPAKFSAARRASTSEQDKDTAVKTNVLRRISEPVLTAVDWKEDAAPCTNDNLKDVPEHEAKREKLFRAVADGDVEMVKFYLDWIEDDDDDVTTSTTTHATVVTINKQLCHPLCQCSKCLPLQRRISTPLIGIPVTTRNIDGLSLLDAACIHGHGSLVSLFVGHGVDVKTKGGPMGMNCLHHACLHDHKQIVDLLLSFGGRVNTRDMRGNTPLHYCARNNNFTGIDCAESLIKFGAKVNLCNQRGNTPLHDACKNNRSTLVTLLLANKADMSAVNRQQIRPAQLTKDKNILKKLKLAGERSASNSVDETESNSLVESLESPQSPLDCLGDVINAINLHDQADGGTSQEQVKSAEQSDTVTTDTAEDSRLAGSVCNSSEARDQNAVTTPPSEMSVLRSALFEPPDVDYLHFNDDQSDGEVKSPEQKYCFTTGSSTGLEEEVHQRNRVNDSPDRCSDVSVAEEVLDDSYSAVDDVASTPSGTVDSTQQNIQSIPDNKGTTSEMASHILSTRGRADSGAESENSNTESHDEWKANDTD